MRISNQKKIVLFTVFLILSFCVNIFAGCSKMEQNIQEEENTNPAEASNRIASEELVDYSGAFQGLVGCAVIYDLQENCYSFYNKSMCEEQVSPYSTFKIVATLMGLKNGVLLDENSTMNYNGTQYLIAEWNKNLTLKEAFQQSCVWYFRQVIDAVGPDEVKAQLEKLEYGNCDISQWAGSNVNPLPDLNGFWLGSSLKISPLEQVKVLITIFEGRSEYETDVINPLENIMGTNEDGQIYGKTGTGTNGTGWFVGFWKGDNQKKYFAVYLEDEQNKGTGKKAKDIVFKILSESSYEKTKE